MKLSFMKYNYLEMLKSNLNITYSRYYTDTDNDWMYNFCAEDPFIEFKEIPDFELAPIDSDLSKGEIDLENCKIVYRNLNFLSEANASDERLWAGLTHSVFYDYMRRRWGYDKIKPKSPSQSIGEIKTRYFFEGGARSGFFRNTLAKCWWVGKALYDQGSKNPFERLDILGSNDLSTKITDIFYSNTYASNQNILNGIINCFRYFNKKGLKLSTRTHIRPTLQFLNAIGGGVILDCLSTEDIAKLMIDNIEKILQGEPSNMVLLDDDLYVDDEDFGKENNSDTKFSQDDLEVSLGCRVIAYNSETKEEKIYSTDYLSYPDKKLPEPVRTMIGLKIGDVFKVRGNNMVIKNIIF